jgi:competence protein ComGC
VLYWVASGLRKIQEARKDERGFTLIELLVVITLQNYKGVLPLLPPN